MADFNVSYKIGRVNEGGYSNNPNDKGGETYAGISRRYHPDWPGWLVIDKHKKVRPLKTNEIIEDQALDLLIYGFYRSNFWNKIRGGEIVDQRVADIFYDWTLTSGGAIRRVQELLKVKPDGKFGPLSVKALNELEGCYAFEMIKQARKEYYISLNQPTFTKGWINRVDSFKYKK